MLLCSNIVVIMLLFWPIIFDQLCIHQNFSPKDIYCRSQNLNNQNIGTLHTNICWRQCPQYIQDASWFPLNLLRITFRAFRWRNTSWWTRCHWHRLGGTRVMLMWYATWPHLFWGKIPFYASIMTQFKSCRLCSKLCWHNNRKPSKQESKDEHHTLETYQGHLKGKPMFLEF